MHIHIRSLWMVGVVLLVLLSMLALMFVIPTIQGGDYGEVCDGQTPILLSRAFTTDPWRGIVIACNILAVVLSYYTDILGIVAAFSLFALAFVISMFDTSATHDELIVIGVVLILAETCPWRFKPRSKWWVFHWLLTVVLVGLCSMWMFGDDACSWWYVTEYVLFVSLFMLVCWRIDDDMYFTDHFSRTPRAVGT